MNLKNSKKKRQKDNINLFNFFKLTLTSQLFFSCYICGMQMIPLFISGAEIAFIVFILVMVFGADKIPEIARGLGKGMRTVRDATNDIKSEITSNADKHLGDMGGKNVKEEVDKVKDEIEEITGSVSRKR